MSQHWGPPELSPTGYLSIGVLGLQVKGPDDVDPDETLLGSSGWQLVELPRWHWDSWVIWERVNLEGTLWKTNVFSCTCMPTCAGVQTQSGRLHRNTESQNHGLVWVGRDSKDLVLNPLPCAGTSSLLRLPSNPSWNVSRDGNFFYFTVVGAFKLPQRCEGALLTMWTSTHQRLRLRLPLQAQF